MEKEDILKKIDQTIENYYSDQDLIEHLNESILYSVHAGGKRIRPLMLLECLQAFGLDLNDEHFKVAAAIELIHTSSLIHDDLPSMDNDDYRRGRLTNHKVYGDAHAILTGDALLLDPYGLLVSARLDSDILVKLVAELSYASGSHGMVAGQVLDLDGENQEISLDDLKKIHSLKTGRMLTIPFVAAGLIAKQDKSVIEQLRTLGSHVGLAFQIRDDIKDLTADFSEIGKTPGKDIVQEKSTYVRFLGLEGAKFALKEELDEACLILSNLEGNLSGSNILNLINSLRVE
jgi:Geranylgeranyl pyrophosphate synthase